MLPFANSAAMSTGVHVSFRIVGSFQAICPVVGLLGRMVVGGW